jgi:outer membrane protein W
VGLSFCYARLAEPMGSDHRLVLQPAASFGVMITPRQAVELTVARLEAEQTWGSGPPAGEGPIRAGFQATPLTVAFRQFAPLAGGRLAPFVDLGVTWARVEDWTESDVPRQYRTHDLFGATGHVGVQWLATPRVSVRASAGYRRLQDPDHRWLSWELSGGLAGLAVQYQL